MIQENMTASHITFLLYRRHFQFAGRILTVMAVLLSLQVKADQSPTPAGTNDASSTDTVAKATLGNVADIEILKGFRLIDRDRTGSYLKQTGNRVPAGLLGILAHESANWFAVMEFTDVGYLKDLEKREIVPTEILQAIRNKVTQDNTISVQRGIPPVLSVEWEHIPVYDPTNHMFAWALRVETPLARMINYKVLLVGRMGVIEVTAIQPAGAATGLPPLEELAKKIDFKDGLRYDDYKSGDKLASLSLVELIVNDQELAYQRPPVASSFFGSWIFFALIGCLVVAGTVGCVVLVKRLARHEIHTETYGTQTIASLISNSGASNHSNGNGNGHGPSRKPLAAESALRINGKNGKNGGRNGGRRKVTFDYSKFYVDFVMSSTNATGAGAVNEISTIGLTEVAPAPEASPVPDTRVRVGSTAEDMELVERLRILIEEQKRLIHQQTRLIEEKNKFIEEQNEFLERQSALVKDQFTLKLE
jgi:uncharacterized membrane-anchored protein